MDLLARLKLLLDIRGYEQDALLSLFIESSTNKVLNKMYPFGFTNTQSVPTKYEYIILTIAMYLYNKQGAEGETSHSENGISRYYGSADVPDVMLKDIMSMGAVIR